MNIKRFKDRTEKEIEEQIQIKEVELHQHYSQMGKCLLEIAESEQRVINKLVDEIIEARANLAMLKKEKECPECTVYNDADSKFCKRCGSKLPEPKKENENGS